MGMRAPTVLLVRNLAAIETAGTRSNGEPGVGRMDES
jgi:hypothetical protein